MNYYEQKAKDGAELVSCWCWTCVVIAVVVAGFLLIKWLFTL